MARVMTDGEGDGAMGIDYASDSRASRAERPRKQETRKRKERGRILDTDREWEEAGTPGGMRGRRHHSLIALQPGRPSSSDDGNSRELR